MLYLKQEFFAGVAYAKSWEFDIFNAIIDEYIHHGGYKRMFRVFELLHSIDNFEKFVVYLAK